MIYRNKRELIEKFSNKNATVLDIGFWGQGKSIQEGDAPHTLLESGNAKVYGIDPASRIVDVFHSKQSAESFSFPFKFDAIWALDIIEHLSNPGLFLDSAKRQLKNDGRLVITTPNCFCLFNLIEKVRKYEPTTNAEHTCYYNTRTLKQLLDRHGFAITESSYVYSLEYIHKESFKKKFLNVIYWFLSKFTDKYCETLATIAVPKV